MTKITEITVERNYTLNMGNYESVRLGMSATAHLSDDDDPDTAYEEVTEYVETKMAAEMDVLKEDD